MDPGRLYVMGKMKTKTKVPGVPQLKRNFGGKNSQRVVTIPYMTEYPFHLPVDSVARTKTFTKVDLRMRREECKAMQASYVRALWRSLLLSGLTWPMKKVKRDINKPG